jgi:hypothetical protein
LFRQYTLTPEGKDYTLDFYRTGRLIDTYASIKLNRPSIVAFEARSDCLVYSVDSGMLKAAALGDHRWYRLFYYNLADRLIGQHERSYSLLCEGSLAKYTRFLSLSTET